MRLLVDIRRQRLMLWRLMMLRLNVCRIVVVGAMMMMMMSVRALMILLCLQWFRAEMMLPLPQQIFHQRIKQQSINRIHQST
jgi:hypothetical protein